LAVLLSRVVGESTEKHPQWGVREVLAPGAFGLRCADVPRGTGRGKCVQHVDRAARIASTLSAVRARRIDAAKGGIDG
jgi:hypothetical protein